MHLIQEEIGFPKIIIDSISETKGSFIVEPLPAGYGMTLGNAFRRVLLSSLPGTSVVAIRVEGATHEFAVLDGVKDSVLDILLNLKGVFFKKESKGRETLVLEKKGEGPVKASDIKIHSDTSILNPEHIITHLSGAKTHLKIEIVIEKNVGYIPAKVFRSEDDLSEFIHTDAVFTPVETVRYNVTPTRVGENTDLDKLHIEIQTNGAIAPEAALEFSANVLTSYFSLFSRDDIKVEQEFMSEIVVKEEETQESSREIYTPIELLNFSQRTLNALINGQIGSVEQLTKCTSSKLQSLRGFGKKALDEVYDTLREKGLKLSDEE